MLKEKLYNLKEHILKYNPYFNNAFDYTVQDENTGIIHDSIPVFPADNLGDYFYLRITNNVRFDNQSIYNTATTISGVGLVPTIILVACVRDADADKLLNNLVNTLRAESCGARIGLVSMLFNGRDVILQELARMKEKENIEAALQRLPSGMTLVSITFTYSFNYTFQKLKCFDPPCNC